ncbi:magnesium transporter [Kineobactrum sediminis]|uniref:Magnesium transporter MgtE n=1 Tax=Kineobactrum sediminis TaxID=1905677 RepID=A0A2N5XY08_9GAMM|nr:magnesium transporter [Kineobactrum sediminis]PLW81034.1 magnesium transporter [Kineobactrum sediminis]
MSHEGLLDDLQTALARRDEDAIQEACARLNPVDIADFLCEQEAIGQGDLAVRLILSMSVTRRAEIFGRLSEPAQRSLASQLPPETLAELVAAMPHDERADLFNVLDESARHDVLKRLAHTEREDLRHLASYKEGTAGAIMTSDYASLPASITVAEAIGVLRNTAPDKETIYQCYVVNGNHYLLGTLSLRDLILAPASSSIDDLMVRDMVTATVDTSQEAVTRKIARYDLLALPITDDGGRLVGIVTYDDAMDVAEAEATEDIHKSATVGKLRRPIGQAGLGVLYRSRISWLVMLVFANILTGAGITHFEETIAAHLSLLFFMPLLIASAGNAGAQASTLMVRGMATGEVVGRDWLRLLGKEILVAGALGITMAVAVMVIGVARTGFDIAMVVAMTMVIVVLMGSLVGLTLPFILDKLDIDPATSSVPLITTVADVGGVVVYFSIATAVLGL